MKKIFTLAIASLLSVAMFAADRKPSVTLTSDKKYEVVIDGKSYASAIGNVMDVSIWNSGRHSIQVYKLKNGLFSKQKKLISSSSFQLSRNDMSISVNQKGQIAIQEKRDLRNGRFDQRQDVFQKDNTRKQRGRF